MEWNTYIILFGLATGIMSLGGILLLVHAWRSGLLGKSGKNALVIFDAEEPAGKVQDFFPGHISPENQTVPHPHSPSNH